MDTPLISIIVPVYNVEQYLCKCIDSILCQTYKNLEVILVNDGSLDNCGTICDEYITKDSRVRVIHKENEGVSMARNNGLDLSKGEYVVFIDGDDFITEKHIENLFNCVNCYSVDVGITSYRTIIEGDEFDINAVHCPKKKIKCFGNIEAIEKIMYQKISGAPWGKIFKKTLFEDLRFPKDIVIAEDLYIIYHVLLRTPKVVFCDDLSYGYVLRKNSADSHNFNPLKTDSIYFVIEDLKSNKILLNSIWNAVECRILNLLFHIFIQTPKKNKTRAQIWNDIKKTRMHVLRNNNTRYKTRIACLISYLGKDFLTFFFSFINKRK